MPSGTHVSDHVLGGKTAEIACKNLGAIVAQVVPPRSYINVQFWNTKGRCELVSMEEGRERHFCKVPLQTSVLNKN